MLAPGRRAVAAAGLASRIELVRARLPGLGRAPGGFHAIVSNSLLHHMPHAEVFWSEIARLGRAGAPALIMDLHRPDSLERAREIVETYSGGEPEMLKRDFFHSLCAAFTLDEVRAQIARAGLDRVRCEMASDRHWVAWGELPS
jgi:ubiquinone/menaquinone biosynthesis C-methylase UbiE